MSGVRRKSKFRKGVEREILEDLPQLRPSDLVARVLASRGGNLVEVEAVDKEDKLITGLCRLPARFRNLVFVKRGTLLIVETSGDEAISTASGEAGKVVFNVQSVVFGAAQIDHLRSIGSLPKQLDPKANTAKPAESSSTTVTPPTSKFIEPPVRRSEPDDDEEEEEEDRSALMYPAPMNRNRAPIAYQASSSDEDDDEEEVEEEDDDDEEADEKDEESNVPTNEE